MSTLLPDTDKIISQTDALIGKTPEALEALVKAMGEPAFRARQLHHWLYVKCVRDWEAMTDLAKTFRQKLAKHYTVGALSLLDKQVSTDGTIKYLFGLKDGKTVESVLIHFDDRDKYSVCLSTQVGCAVNCSFCATGKLGFSRHLSTAEIVEQYLYVQGDSQKEVKNIVLMGQGEPLLNLDQVLPAIKLLNRSAEVGMRNITLSTSGIVPGIERLAVENLQLTLAVSLHAPDNALRDKLVPVNQKWPLEVLLPALRRYEATTHRRLTIEYILLAGVNDSEAQAHQLGTLLRGLKCNVNLIPYNPIDDVLEEVPGNTPDETVRGYQKPTRASQEAFKAIVTSYGKKVTIRLERGADIDAACGQLANRLVNR